MKAKTRAQMIEYIIWVWVDNFVLTRSEKSYTMRYKCEHWALPTIYYYVLFEM